MSDNIKWLQECRTTETQKNRDCVIVFEPSSQTGNTKL